MSVLLSISILLVIASAAFVVVWLMRARPTVLDKLDALERLPKLSDSGGASESEYERLKRKKWRGG
jgi:hypothetical protein